MQTAQDIHWHSDPGDSGLEREALLRGVDLLAEGCAAGLQPGGQVYISRWGTPVLEYAVGEASPGVPMTVDHIVPWFSASKPVAALAIALLYDRAALDLDDPVRRYLPAFGQGKEGVTLRHVLTHTGGFAGALDHEDFALPTAEALKKICAHPAEYPPGHKAGYHPVSGWIILGEIVRLVDGRPVDVFTREEIFAPLGVALSQMGFPPGQQAALGTQMALVAQGKTDRKAYADQNSITRRNSEREIAAVNPAGGIRGPARELGRLYEWMLAKGHWQGKALLDRRTVELFTACHRWEQPDLTLMGAPLAWGLGVCRSGNADVHRGFSRRSFNHSGMVSSVAVGDPQHGLVCAVVTTGLLDPLTNARRLRALTGTAVEALRS